MATSGAVTIDLDNVGEIVNNSTTLGDFVMAGVKDQGELIGLAIGIALAIGLLISLIFLVIGIIPRLIKSVKSFKRA